jgi:NADPH:quinone reductase-like Zn-dependent oxidoreductase
MRLIQFREPGPPSVLQCLDVPIPEPNSGEVLIRALAIGVGIPDTLIRAGTYGFMPPLPATPGTELSGTIETVAPDVTCREPGQRVYVTARERPHRGGHYAQYVTAPAEATFCYRMALISIARRRSPIIRWATTSSTMRCGHAKARASSFMLPPVAWAMR